MLVSALRVPGGNLVDGLPPARHTKTVAKRARVEPRTQMHMTMTILFWRMISSTSARLSDMIVLDNVLKIWIELRKQRNDNVMEKFYMFLWFRKVDILARNFENFENFRKKWQFHWGGRSCSTSYPSGNQVEGSPLVANAKTIAKRARVGPRT